MRQALRHTSTANCPRDRHPPPAHRRRDTPLCWQRRRALRSTSASPSRAGKWSRIADHHHIAPRYRRLTPRAQWLLRRGINSLCHNVTAPRPAWQSLGFVMASPIQYPYFCCWHQVRRFHDTLPVCHRRRILCALLSLSRCFAYGVKAKRLRKRHAILFCINGFQHMATTKV